jgi:hypothetical protein
MKKRWIIALIFLVLSGLVAAEKKIDKGLELDKDSCGYVCSVKLKELCPKSSIKLLACLDACAKWTDRNIRCMSSATQCEQINLNEGTCREEDIENPYVYPPEEKADAKCSKACTNYKKCASFADDATQEDLQSAYDTCMGECKNWSPKMVSCVSSVTVTSPWQCMKVTQCGLEYYQGMMEGR